MSGLMEGIRNQYLTYPWQVKKPFGNFVVGEVIKAHDVQERGDSYVIVFDNNISLKLKSIEKYVTLYEAKSDIAQPDPLGNKALIDEKKAKEVGLDPLPTPVEENKQPQFPMRAADLGVNLDKVNNIVKKPDPSYFGKFNSSERELKLNVKVKMPDLSLINAMYESAKDQDEFIKELAEYLHSNINIELIQDAVLKTLKNNNNNG